MRPSHKACRCHCNPCVCPSPGGFGCVQDACVPRPCFFQGQLVGAEDLNALTTYARTKDALLARFVGGWGVAGGMRLRPAPGIRARSLEPDRSRNPALLAGTKIEVGKGVAIDALGRTLTLCAPRILDVAALAADDPTAPESRPCAEWFGTDASFCEGGDIREDLTARPYFVVAEYEERPTRPAPMLAGGGACDPAPSCDFSRTLEEVRIRLVRRLPPAYELTGCLDDVPFEPIERPPADPDELGTEYGNMMDEILDNVLEQLADMCCTRPAVVLGRVLLTSDTGTVRTDDLPDVPTYTFIDDARQLRRLLPSAALQWIVLTRRELELRS
jgi:hypothetical protein